MAGLTIERLPLTLTLSPVKNGERGRTSLTLQLVAVSRPTGID